MEISDRAKDEGLQRTEQRAQSDACIGYAESRRTKTLSNPSTQRGRIANPPEQRDYFLVEKGANTRAAIYFSRYGVDWEQDTYYDPKGVYKKHPKIISKYPIYHNTHSLLFDLQYNHNSVLYYYLFVNSFM